MYWKNWVKIAAGLYFFCLFTVLNDIFHSPNPHNPSVYDICKVNKFCGRPPSIAAFTIHQAQINFLWFNMDEFILGKSEVSFSVDSPFIKILILSPYTIACYRAGSSSSQKEQCFWQATYNSSERLLDN